MKRKHQDLLAWQEGVGLLKAIYQLTKTFPREELFVDFTNAARGDLRAKQHRRGGCTRFAPGVRSLSCAYPGSLSELETQLTICRELGYASDTSDVNAALDRLFRLVAGLIESNIPGN